MPEVEHRSAEAQSRIGTWATTISKIIAPEEAHIPVQQTTEEDQALIDTEGIDELAPIRKYLQVGLSHFNAAVNGSKMAFLKLSLPNVPEFRPEMLSNFPLIQTLDIQENNLSDLKEMKLDFLVDLNASRNVLSSTFFYPPENLQILDLSHNQIKSIGDLSVHPFLRKLNLGHNQITEITGLLKCKRLQELNLSHNSISEIKNLGNLPIKVLDLKCNQISSASGLEGLVQLQTLYIQQNHISSTLGFHAGQLLLGHIDLSHNQITSDLDQFEKLPRIRQLDLSMNPVNTTSQYRSFLIFRIPRLVRLDGVDISPEEKVKAGNIHNPSPEVIASVEHAEALKNQAKSYAKLRASDGMKAKHFRPVILCGPSGAGKRTLANRLLTEFPHIYGHTISHTTRRPRPGEENGIHYHFVSRPEMQRLMDQGEFIQTVNLLGNLYGTSFDAIDHVSEEGKICVMALELEGVISLKKSHLDPVIVFIDVPDIQVLQKRLEDRLTDTSTTTSEDQVRKWLEKVPKVKEFAQDPKFFQCHIVNNDLDEAYQRLKEFCLDVYRKSAVGRDIKIEHMPIAA